MTDRRPQSEALRQVLNDAIDIVPEGRSLPRAGPGTAPLPGLLQQCETLLADLAARPAEPVRMVHHFACTGGTLITRSLSTAPNIQVFSEIEPLSTHHFTRRRRPFFPTDLMADLHYSPRPVPEQFKADYFVAGLQSLYDNFNEVGQRLLIRDHAHSQFCLGARGTAITPARTLVAQVAPVLSIVTVRHPMQSFLALTQQAWLHFEPATLEEYAIRYLQFLDHYQDAARFRYEDFVADPDEQLAAMLAPLDLRPAEDFEELSALFTLSGDSGRGGGRIAARADRPVPDTLAEQAEACPSYQTLCDILGYAP